MAGTMSGTVIDIRNNAPIDGVSLEAKGPSGSGSATSGSNGEWGPISLPAGTYDLTASKQGYEPADFPGVVVLDNIDTKLQLPLYPADYFD